MSRPLRIEYAGALYHVLNRGADRKAIFLDPANDRAIFLGILGEAAQLWKIRVHAFSLMSNHYHLLVETPVANLSHAMRHIDGVYTQRLNRKYHRDGPLFRGRFKSILIQKESYFLELVRYIHLNGVKAGDFPDAGMDPRCSHGEYMGIRAKPPWLTTELALSYFDPRQPGAPGRFDQFVRSGVPQELENILIRKRWPAILGLKEFVAEIKERFSLAKPPHQEKPQEKDLVLKPVDPDLVLKGIGEIFNVDEGALLQRGSHKNSRARQTAMYVFRFGCRLSCERIGKALGGMRSSAVVYGLNQFKKQGMGAELRKIVGDKFGIPIVEN